MAAQPFTRHRAPVLRQAKACLTLRFMRRIGTLILPRRWLGPGGHTRGIVWARRLEARLTHRFGGVEPWGFGTGGAHRFGGVEPWGFGAGGAHRFGGV